MCVYIYIFSIEIRFYSVVYIYMCMYMCALHCRNCRILFTYMFIMHTYMCMYKVDSYTAIRKDEMCLGEIELNLRPHYLKSDMYSKTNILFPYKQNQLCVCALHIYAHDMKIAVRL